MKSKFKINNISGYDVCIVDGGNKYEELLLWFSRGAMNESSDFKGSTHLTEHLLAYLSIDGKCFRDFLSDNNIMTEYKTSYDFMYIYLRGRDKCISNNFFRIFEYLCHGVVYDTDIIKEKRVVHDERALRGSFIRSKIVDRHYKYVWKDNRGDDILGTADSVKLYNSKFFNRIRNEIISSEVLSIIYSGNSGDQISYDFRKIISSVDEETNSLIYDVVEPKKSFCYNETVECKQDSEIKQCTLMYPVGKAHDRIDSIINSVFGLLLSFGTRGYLVDALRYGDRGVYYIIAKPSYLFDEGYIEITALINKGDVSETAYEIEMLLKNKSFENYIHDNLDFVKEEMLEFIDFQNGDSNSNKEFMLFLAKEKQINGIKDLEIDATKSIISSIEFKNIIDFRNRYIDDKCCKVLIG